MLYGTLDKESGYYSLLKNIDIMRCSILCFGKLYRETSQKGEKGAFV